MGIYTQNPNSGKWLNFQYTGILGTGACGVDQDFYLSSEELVAGSYLPTSLLAQDGKQIYWGWFSATFYSTPTFIPYTSSLDLTGGQSKFAITLKANFNHFHDDFPLELADTLSKLAMDTYLITVQHSYEFDNGETEPPKQAYVGVPFTFSVPGTVTKNGTSYVFCSWNDGTNQNPRTVSATGNVTYIAYYKAHLGSSIPTATVYNSQRKVAKSGSNYHMVYSSSGDVYYCSSTNSGATWAAEQRVSNNSYGTQRYNPSISLDTHNNLFLAYETTDGTHHAVSVRMKQSGGQWQDLVGITWFDGATELRPVIWGEYYPSYTPRFMVVVQAGGFNSNNSPGLYYLYQSNQGVVVPVTQVPGTSASSMSPTLTWMNLAYQDGNAIYATYITYGTSSVSFGNNVLVSNNYVNGRLVTAISNPSIDIRVETGSDVCPIIAWQATDMIFNTYRPVFVRHPIGGSYPSPTFATTVFDWGNYYSRGRTPSVTSCLSGSQYNPDVAAVWQDDPSNPNGNYTNVVAVNKISGSWSGETILTSSGLSTVSAPGDVYQANGGALAAWTSTSGPVYQINASQGTNGQLHKSTRPVYARGMNVDLSKCGIAGLGGFLSLTFHESPGAVFRPFTDSATVENFFRLSIQSAVSTTFDLSLMNVKVPANLSATQRGTPVISLTATEAGSSSKTLGAITIGDLLDIWAKRTKVDDSTEIATMAGNTISISPGTLQAVLNSQLQKGFGSLQLFEYILSSDSVGLKKMAEGFDFTPAEYQLLANYPNPFNPSTQISYSLPEAGQVSLVIYDVLGREVATLANANQQTGRYTVTWNATQNSGVPVSSGVYFARLRVLNDVGGVKFTKTIRLLLTK